MFGISAMKSCPETGADTFKEALKESLEEMHDLTLQANQNAKLWDTFCETTDILVMPIYCV